MNNGSPATPRVLVTGSSGFLGRFVVHELREKGCEIVEICRREGFDLLRETDTLQAVLMAKPGIVIHLASTVAGEPGTVFRNNLRMGMNVLDACMMVGAKFVTVAPRSIYAPASFFGSSLDGKPLPETYLTMGPASDGVGDAKRALAVACRLYAAQYQRPYAFLVLPSLYGPTQPSCGLDQGTNRGIGYMAKTIVDAKEFPEFAFGDLSGEELVEGLFILDAARAVVSAAFDLVHDGAVNLPGGPPVTRAKLAEIMAEKAEYKGKIHFDAKAPAPTPLLAGDLAERLFKWKAATPIERGVLMTVDWFLSDREVQETKA